MGRYHPLTVIDNRISSPDLRESALQCAPTCIADHAGEPVDEPRGTVANGRCKAKRLGSRLDRGGGVPRCTDHSIGQLIRLRWVVEDMASGYIGSAAG